MALECAVIDLCWHLDGQGHCSETGPYQGLQNECVAGPCTVAAQPSSQQSWSDWNVYCQQEQGKDYGICVESADGDFIQCFDDVKEEICGNSIDDDGDGLVDESENGKSCTNDHDPPDTPEGPPDPEEPNPPEDGPQPDEPTAGTCDDICGNCDAEPVNLYNREMYAGPFEDLRIETGHRPIVFSRLFDSVRQKNDEWEKVDRSSGFSLPAFVSPFGHGWRHSFEDSLVINHGFYNNNSYDGQNPDDAVLI